MAIPARRDLGLGLLALLLLGGCNLFQPRTPEPPSHGGIVPNYSTPDLTLETMAQAIEAKAAGNSLEAYIGALADSVAAGDAQTFIAFFDPNVVSALGQTPPPIWGPALERQLFTHLPDLSGNRYNFAWLEDIQNPNDEDPAPNVKILHRQYLLTATPEGSNNPETLATGYADLTFIMSRTNSHWVISRWQDRFDPAVGPHPSSGNESFSALRLSQSY
jgi:hypothetical protein